MERKKIILAAFAAAVLTVVCVYAHFHPLGEVKGQPVELADFTDTPYDENLGKMSEECVYDLNFDGTDDVFWFDQNYPRTVYGECPFIVCFKIGEQRIRLDGYDVKTLHSLILADLSSNDRCCDLIISMTQGTDGTQKTSVVNIPHDKMVASPNIKDLLLPKSQSFAASYWHLGETDGRDQQACLIDGLYQGVSEDGYLLIGEYRLRPQREYVLVAQTEETNT